MAAPQSPPDNTTPAVDTSPLSPTTSRERRDSLEKHLQSRPAEQDLKDRHILLDTNAAPALQAKQQELERQRVSDSLKKGLERRPEKEELVERNILMDTKAAGGLQEKQKELEKHMRADSLENHIKARPKPAELIEKGILNGELLPRHACALWNECTDFRGAADENPVQDS